MKFCASAPGSLMLFGEHAVLHGKQALCCAVDQRIHVTLSPRTDSQIHLVSPLGRYQSDLKSFEISPPFEFVLMAIDHFRADIRKGFDLAITSEFSSTMGLGSSSAVSVAMVGLLANWLQLNYSLLQIFNDAKDIVLKVQGVGSGADVAAAVFGGIVAYRLDPFSINSLSLAPDISLVYSGAKVSTKTVIGWVAQRQRAEPLKYQHLFEAVHLCATQAIKALQQKDWATLGGLMNHHHALQAELGVSTPLLEELVDNLRGQAGIFGAKISGSGMGDSVIALGNVPENLFPLTEKQRQAGVKQVPVKISTHGYQYESF